MRMKLIVWCWLLAGLFVMAGCGGGGSGSGPATPMVGVVATPTVSGVAAAGAVLSGTVYLKDSAATSKELSKTIATDGSYSFDVTGMTKPYLLKAVGTANGTSYTLYSMAADKGIANINPMTHLVVVNAAGGGDPATIYNAPQAATVQTMASKLPQAVTDVQTSLNALLTAHNIATVNPISDAYKADHTGLDGMLDVVNIDASNGMITLTNASTGATIFTGQMSNIKGSTVIVGNIPQPNEALNSYFPLTKYSTWTYNTPKNATTPLSQWGADGYSPSTTIQCNSDLQSKPAIVCSTDLSANAYIVHVFMYDKLTDGFRLIKDELSYTGDKFLRINYNTGSYLVPDDMTIGNKYTANYDESFDGINIYSINKNTAITSVVGKEKITVPAGSFDSVKVQTIIYYNSNYGTTYNDWYVKGVGRVKVQNVENGSTAELVSYSIK